MSEPIPESIPTSQDPRSQRPAKKRKPLTESAAQSAAVQALFEKQPEIQMPSATTKAPKTVDELPPPPEIVANVQGSSAGAGSGEFHVYKAARRREYERIRLMEEEAAREEANREWERKRVENQKKNEGKVSKSKRRRQKWQEKKTIHVVDLRNEVDSNGDATGKDSGPAKLPPKRPVDDASDDDKPEQAQEQAGPVVEEQGILIEED